MVSNDTHNVVLLGIVRVEVDTADKHRGIARGCRDDDFLGPARSNVHLGPSIQ